MLKRVQSLAYTEYFPARRSSKIAHFDTLHLHEMDNDVNTSSSRNSKLRLRLNQELEQIESWNLPICCKRNCTGNLGIDKCRQLRQEFLQGNQVQRKAKLLSMRVSVSSLAKNTKHSVENDNKKYAIEAYGVILCTEFLVNVLNVHRQLASSVLKRPSAECSDLPGRQLNSVTSGNFESSIVAFLHILADEVGDEMPHNVERHLPHRSKKIVYALYCESQRDLQEPSCNRSHFYNTWRSLVSHIKCRKSHTFAVCDTCISFRERLTQIARKTSRDEERSELLKGFRCHLRSIKLERAEYARHRIEAMERPAKVLSVIIDGADQSKFGIPQFAEKSKSEAGNAIKQKITGVLFHGGLGRGEFLTYLTSADNLPSGANQTIDAFSRCFLVLLEHRAFKQSLTKPEILYIQLDNTSKDNKNRFFMAFCEWLIHHGVFKEVHVNFLPVGHTHEDIDRKFSRISVTLSCQDTITVQDLHRALRQSVLSANKPHVARVRGYNNFSKALEIQKSVVKSVLNFSGYRKFVFERSGPLDIRNHEFLYYVSNYAATSMVTAKPDWEKLPTLKGSVGAFLLRDIDFCALPPTRYSKVSDEELRQMRRRIRSVETRIRNKDKVEDLFEAINSMENETVAFPDWSFEELLEKCRDTVSECPFSDESESDDELEYAIGNMVTVRHSKSDSATPFWVGSVTGTNASAPNEIVVNWYELIQEDSNASQGRFSADSRKTVTISSYNGRYRPCTGIDGDLLCDVVSSKCVLITFERLTAEQRLPVRVRMLTRQALDPFLEDNEDEEGSESPVENESSRRKEHRYEDVEKYSYYPPHPTDIIEI